MVDLRAVLRRYAFAVLVALAAVESSVEVAFRHDALRAPRTTLWVAIPAIVVVFVPLFAFRRAPFAAPAALWIVAAALSFVDGRLIVFPAAVFAAGMAAAFLLGNLIDGFQARVGLVVVVAAAAVVASNDPTRSAGEYISLPVLFAIAWTLGLTLRARSGQAEAAEERATRAERERETSARIAVAEERARIARELHDIVAHSMSVMVLQVGAVRHGLPDKLADDKQALEDVERTGRAALTEMRRVLGAMRHETDDAIPVTFDTLMHVVAGNSIANVTSVTPGGVGVTQAFNVASLQGVTTTETATAFSVTQQLIMTAWNIVVALVLVVWAFGWRGGRSLVEQSYAEAKEKEAEHRAARRARKRTKPGGEVPSV